MFNYAAIDKHITLGHLALLMKWYAEEDTKTSSEMMVTGIDRKGADYMVHLSNACTGFTHKFSIADGKVSFMGCDRVWMS